MLPSPFYTSVPLMTATIPNGPQRPEQLPSSSNATRLFGHILDNSNVQQSAPLPQLRATPALGTFTAAEHGNNISQSRNTYIGGKTGRPPVYFDPADGSAAGGLVCGLESDSKYTVLKNLMASCLSPNDDSASRDSANNEASRSILCFTAENGSFRIVEALSSLAHDAQEQNRAKVIVLVAPREVEDAGMQYINSKLENIDVTILPLLIHWEDINLDHLSYMADKADPYHSVVQDMQAAIQPELHKLNLISGWFHTTHFENKPLRMLNAAFSRDHFSRSAQPLHKHKLTPGERWPPAPAWMEWILSEQPNLPEKIEPITPPTHSQSSDSSEAGSDPHPARPVILCVDFTGFPQENIVLQHVLADLVLKGWLDHYQPTGSSGTGRNLVVCDYPELYLSEGPFARRLQRLISPSALASASAASRDPLPSEDTTPVLSSFGSTLSPRYANVLLLTRSPTSIPPNLLDSLSYLVIHRFTSPRCLKALQEHFFLSDGAIRHSLDSQENDGKRDHPISSSVNALYDPRLMDRIMSLREDQVLLFTTSQTKTPFAYSERVASDTSTNRNETIQPPSKPHFKLPFKGGHQRRLVLVRLFSDEQEDEVDLKEEIEEPVTRNVDLSKSMVYSSSAPHLGRSPLQTQAQVLPGQSLLGQTLGSHPQVEIGGYTTSHHQAVRHTPSAVPPKIWGPSVLTTDSTTISGSAALGGESEFFLTPGRGAGVPAVGVIGSRGNNPGIIGSTDFNSGANHYSNPQSTARLSPTTSRGMRTASPFTLGATGNQLSTGLAYSPGPISPPILGNKSSFSPFVSPRNERDVYPLGSSPQLPNDFRGFQHPGHDQNNFHVPSEVQSSSGKESRDDSSAGYVEGGAASGGGSSSSFSGGQAAGNPVSPSNAGGYGFAALGLKRSYAGVTAPPNLQDSVGSNSTASYSNTNRSTFGPTTSSQDASSPTTEPPIYPLSFFWPLLDALEKARQQVSTPHNRAQSVRHSVVGQELPPTARARLALTFKEYVAAAARAGVIVTGDSGDKAWIALREWKYPGKGLGGLHVTGGGGGGGPGGGGPGSASGGGSASGSGGAGGSRVASK